MKVKNKVIIATGLGLSALLASCSTAEIDSMKQGYSLSNTQQTFPAVSADKVVLVYKDAPNAKELMPCDKYKTISMVSVLPYNAAGISKSDTTIANAFKDGGASVGADAVINIVNSQGIGSNAEGYAIKCDK